MNDLKKVFIFTKEIFNVIFIYLEIKSLVTIFDIINHESIDEKLGKIDNDPDTDIIIIEEINAGVKIKEEKKENLLDNGKANLNNLNGILPKAFKEETKNDLVGDHEIKIIQMNDFGEIQQQQQQQTIYCVVEDDDDNMDEFV